jgi:hypothetical protein
VAAGAANGSQEDVSEFEDKNILLVRPFNIRMLSKHKAKHCIHNAQSDENTKIEIIKNA